MKNTTFIIPLVLRVQPKFLFLLLFSIAHCQITLAIDTNGCLVTYTASQRLYYTARSGGGPFDFVTLSGSPAFSGYFSAGTSRCIDNYGTACNVYDGTTGALYRTGTYARLYDCPLDDYTTLILIFTIIVAVSKLSRLRLVT